MLAKGTFLSSPLFRGEIKFMIAPKDSIPSSQTALPNSRRVYVSGQVHPQLRVPFREISLSPTKGPNGRVEENAPVCVYDCSGPWGDPSFAGNVEEGLPVLRRDWILARKDVAEYDGRVVTPRDNGYLSEQHQGLHRSGADAVGAPKSAGRRPLRASAGHPVTQLWYAR